MIAKSRESQAIEALDQKYPDYDYKVHLQVTRHTEAKLEDGTPLYYWGLRTDLGVVGGFGLKPQQKIEDSNVALRVNFYTWRAVLFTEGGISPLRFVRGESGGEIVFAPVGEIFPL